MAEENLLTPEVDAPKGIPPKKLVVAIFAVVSLSAVALWAIFNGGGDPAPVTGDSIARNEAAKLPDAEKATVGNARNEVSEAYAKSGLPASITRGGTQSNAAPATGTSAASASPSASAVAAGVGASGAVANPFGQGAHPAPLPPGMPVPMNRGGTAVGGPAGGPVDPGEAARVVEVLNSKVVVADYGDDIGGAAGAKKPPAPGGAAALDAEIAAARARLRDATNNTGGSGDGGLVQGMAELAKNQQPQSARARDAKFLDGLSSVQAKPPLMQSLTSARYLISEGTVIPAVLDRAINSDLPGTVTARVSQNVYDSTTSRHVLICKGSRVIGRYQNEIRMGQSRLLFAFTRLILPDGTSFDLAGFDGADANGSAGVTGDVDRHFFRVFGASLAIGVLADRVTRTSAVPTGLNGGISATGQILADTARAELQRNRDIEPTISIERGSRINVEVRRDMAFPGPVAGSC